MNSDRRTEGEVRSHLAVAYRPAAMAGWDDTIYTHLSAAVPADKGHYLLNEFGLACEVVGASPRPVTPAGFTIHAAVHAARSDVECVIHLHSPWAVALSMIPEGLLPVSQWAMRFHGRLGPHACEGLAMGVQEQQRLVANLATSKH